MNFNKESPRSLLLSLTRWVTCSGTTWLSTINYFTKSIYFTWDDVNRNTHETIVKDMIHFDNVCSISTKTPSLTVSSFEMPTDLWSLSGTGGFVFWYYVCLLVLTLIFEGVFLLPVPLSLSKSKQKTRSSMSKGVFFLSSHTSPGPNALIHSHILIPMMRFPKTPVMKHLCPWVVNHLFCFSRPWQTRPNIDIPLCVFPCSPVAFAVLYPHWTTPLHNFKYRHTHLCRSDIIADNNGFTRNSPGE